jgi:hypothetical protein
MDCYKLIQEHNARSRVKIELKRAGVNFYKNDTLDVLESKLAYALTHQPSTLKKLFFFFKR